MPNKQAFWREKSLWPLSHSIVPLTFYAITNSLVATIIGVYLWESIEFLLSLLLRSCCGSNALSEKKADSLIGDPLLGIFSTLPLFLLDVLVESQPNAQEHQRTLRAQATVCIDKGLSVGFFVLIAASLMFCGFIHKPNTGQNRSNRLATFVVATTIWTPTIVTIWYLIFGLNCVEDIDDRLVKEVHKLIGLPISLFIHGAFVMSQTIIAIVYLASTNDSYIFVNLCLSAIIWTCISITIGATL